MKYSISGLATNVKLQFVACISRFTSSCCIWAWSTNLVFSWSWCMPVCCISRFIGLAHLWIRIYGWLEFNRFDVFNVLSASLTRARPSWESAGHCPVEWLTAGPCAAASITTSFLVCLRRKVVVRQRAQASGRTIRTIKWTYQYPPYLT